MCVHNVRVCGGENGYTKLLVCTYVLSLYLSVRPSVNIFFYPSVRPSTYPPISLSIYIPNFEISDVEFWPNK